MAPKQAPNASQYLDEHHQRISEFADEYFDDEEERAQFVDTLLERRGYQRTAGWSLPAPPTGDPGGANGSGAPPADKRPPYFRR